MSISIASPSAGNAANPTPVTPTFTVTGSYDGTPNGTDPEDTDADDVGQSVSYVQTSA